MIFQSHVHLANAFPRKPEDELRALVLATGCFDWLTPGHVKFLRQSCEDFFYAGEDMNPIPLVVGINSDESVRRLKGNSRPILNEHDRAYMLSELRCVEHIFIFHESTVTETLEIIRPRCWIKGGDRTLDSLHPRERSMAEQIGIEIRFIPRIGDYSTTSLHKKLQAQQTTQ